MSTKLISAVIIVLVLLGGWGLYSYWETFQEKKETEKKQPVHKAITGDQLPGLPPDLAPSLDAAQKQGARAMHYWLQAHSRVVHDPRLAWIELDYCTMIARENPAEARKVFADVKQRIPPSSPVYQRVQDLKASFE
jgi:hypothetical protein